MANVGTPGSITNLLFRMGLDEESVKRSYTTLRTFFVESQKKPIQLTVALDIAAAKQRATELAAFQTKILSQKIELDVTTGRASLEILKVAAAIDKIKKTAENLYLSPQSVVDSIKSFNKFPTPASATPKEKISYKLDQSARQDQVSYLQQPFLGKNNQSYVPGGIKNNPVAPNDPGPYSVYPPVNPNIRPSYQNQSGTQYIPYTGIGAPPNKPPTTGPGSPGANAGAAKVPEMPKDNVNNLREMVNLGRALTHVFHDIADAAEILAQKSKAATDILVAGLKEAVNTAAKEEKAYAHHDAVFKEFAHDARGFVDNIANANQALTKTEVADRLAEFYSAARALSLTNDQAFEMSKNMVQLGSDLQKVHGDEFGTILDAIRAQLVRGGIAAARYGIQIRAADVENEAARLGFMKYGQELTRNELAQARQSAILKQASFVKQQVLNVTRSENRAVLELAGAYNQLMVALGKPLLARITSWIDLLANATRNAAKFIQENPKIVDILFKITVAAIAVTTALTTFATGLTIASAFATALVGTMITLALAAGPLVATVEAIGAALIMWPAWVAAEVIAVAGGFTAIAGAIGLLVGTAGIAGVVVGMVQFAQESKNAWIVLRGLEQVAASVFNGIKTLFYGIFGPIIAFVKDIGDTLAKELDRRANEIGLSFTDIAGFIRESFQTASGIIKTVLETIFGFFGPMIKAGLSVALTLFERLPLAIESAKNAFEVLSPFISIFFDLLLGGSKEAGEGFNSFRDKVVNALRNLDAYLTEVNVIKFLANVKISLIEIASTSLTAFSYVKDVFSILERHIGSLIYGIGLIVRALSYVMPTMMVGSKKIGEELTAFGETLSKDAAKRLKNDSKERIRIEQETQKALKAAREEFDDPQAALDKYRKSIADRRKVTEEELAKTKAAFALKNKGAATGSVPSLTAPILGEATVASANDLKNSVSAIATDLKSAGNSAGDLDEGLTQSAATAKGIRKLLQDRHKAQQDAKKEQEEYNKLKAQATESEENEIAAIREKQKLELQDVTDAETIAALKEKFNLQEQEISIKYERKREEATKNATAKAVEAEYQLAESRAHATETIDDDIAALRKRQDEELKLAKSEDERFQMRRANLAKEKELVENLARKHEETIKQQKNAAKAIDDFDRANKDVRDRRLGFNVEADVRDEESKVRNELKNVDGKESGTKLKSATKTGIENLTDKYLDATIKANDEAEKAKKDFKDKQRKGFRNSQDRKDAEEERDTKIEAARKAQEEYNKAIDKGSEAQFKLNKEIDETVKKVLKANADREADVKKKEADAEKRAKGPPQDKPQTDDELKKEIGDKYGYPLNGSSYQGESGTDEYNAAKKKRDDLLNKKKSTQSESTDGGTIGPRKDSGDSILDQINKAVNDIGGGKGVSSILNNVQSALTAMVSGQSEFTHSMVDFGAVVVDKMTTFTGELKTLTSEVNTMKGKLASLGKDKKTPDVDPALAATGN